MAITLSVSPFGGSSSILNKWWQFALVGVVIFGVVVGTISFVASTISRMRQSYLIKKASTKLSPKTIALVDALAKKYAQTASVNTKFHLDSYSPSVTEQTSARNSAEISPTKAANHHSYIGSDSTRVDNLNEKDESGFGFVSREASEVEPISPSSVTVFLGGLSTRLSSDETRVISQSSLLIIDPQQPNVLPVLANRTIHKSPYRAARVDFSRFMRNGAQKRAAALSEPSMGINALSPDERQQFMTEETKRKEKEGGVVSNEPPPLKPATRLSDQDCREFLDRMIAGVRESVDYQGKRVCDGVVVTDWDGVMPIPMLEAAGRILKSMGLNVYVEVSAPAFFDREGPPNLLDFAGVVIRNATTLPNGQIRDFFAMTRMKSLVKAFVSQACLRSFTVVMWESIEDQAFEQLEPAVIGRCYGWSRYHGGIVDLNPASALLDASKNRKDRETIGAFRWLKEQPVMDVHQLFRESRFISPEIKRPGAAYSELAKLVPSVEWIVRAANDGWKKRQSIAGSNNFSLRRTSRTSRRHSDLVQSPLIPYPSDTEWWSSALQPAASHPLSVSHLGCDYSGLGVIPLGLDVTPEDFDHVVQSQGRLRRLDLLDRMLPEDLTAMSNSLRRVIEKLKAEAQSPTPTGPDGSMKSTSAPATRPSSHSPKATYQLPSEVILALSALASWLSSETACVYKGMDSGFRVPNGAQFWGCYDYEETDNSLVLYVSARAVDTFGTIVHLWLSTRRFSRAQCFLSEERIWRMHEELSKDNFFSNGDSTRSSRYESTIVEKDEHLGAKEQGLPPRLIQDLGILAPSDMLLFLQHIHFSGISDFLLRRIHAACTEHLVDMPLFRQLQKSGNVDYLRGTITPEELVNKRLSWYRANGSDYVPTDASIQIFLDIDALVRTALQEKGYDIFTVLLRTLQQILQKTEDDIERETYSPTPIVALDSLGNFVAFCIFCAARKYAYEEVYIEVSDRNPLFNQYPDQAAALAELFALGSRCDAYFDISPNEMGKILSDRHRAWYMKPENQPPLWIDNAPSFASAYAAAQTDMGPDPTAPNGGDIPKRTGTNVTAVPRLQRFTFLSVFAIPALVDIVLLTITGHGLYLSAFMTKDEMRHATLALMISLLLSGGIGTWISIGATYYLSSMAFSAANMFILTRLIGGLAFAVLAGLVGFAIISGIDGPGNGLVFLLYFIVLTSYLSVLAAVSGYQAIGSSFLNGRVIIIAVLPTLLISPIITTFVGGHDLLIYLLVLYLFILLLMFGLRHVASEWVTWYSDIRTVDDEGVKKWFVDQHPAEAKAVQFETLSAPAQMKTARLSLFHDVTVERELPFWKRWFSKKPKKENSRSQALTRAPSAWAGLVSDLARSWPATIFLLNWYCGLTDVQRPMPYTSTWNIQVRVALDTLLMNQKGIRLHSSFIHWRHAGHEVGCGILYFIVALMDRWVELFFGGPLVGLSAGTNKTLRMATGFGLAYYLIGAVLLDYKAHHLHHSVEKAAPLSVSNQEMLHSARVREARFRRRLYITTLLRFVAVQVWTLAITAVLVWVFAGDDRDGLGMFLSYVGAYSGLLLYQYNKIFAGPHALAPLLTAVAVGLPAGILLRYFQQHLLYVNVIGLAFSTWLAALLSIKSAKIDVPRKVKLPSASTGNDSRAVYHGYSGGTGTGSGTGYNNGPAADIGFADPHWSQAELEALYTGAISDRVRSGDRLPIAPGGDPGFQVEQLLLSLTQPNALTPLAAAAFPDVDQLVAKIIKAWKDGTIKIEVVSLRELVPPGSDITAISRLKDGKLHLMVASSEDTGELPDSGGYHLDDNDRVESNCRAVAEILLHAAAENLFGLAHHHAFLFESILLCRTTGAVAPHEATDNSITPGLSHAIPEGLRRGLTGDVTAADMSRLAEIARRQVLLNLCFGLDPDITWDNLSYPVRRELLERCLGETGKADESSAMIGATSQRRMHARDGDSAMTPTMMVEQVCKAGCADPVYAHNHADASISSVTKLARYNLGAHLAMMNYNHFREQYPAHLNAGFAERKAYCAQLEQDAHLMRFCGPNTRENVPRSLIRFFNYLRRQGRKGLHKLGTAVKFISLAPVADPEYQRELDCTLSEVPRFIAVPVVFILTSLWRLCRFAQGVALPFFLLHGRTELTNLWKSLRGPTTELLSGSRLSIKADGKVVTGFIHRQNERTFGMYVYPGHHSTEPDRSKVVAIGIYDSKSMRLLSRAEYMDGRCVNEYVYEYSATDGRIPHSRMCVRGRDEGSMVQYNSQGFMEAGSYRGGNGTELVRFKYHYRRNAKFNDELLRAEFILPQASVNVSWAAPPIRNANRTDRWIPHSRVREATVVLGPTVYEAQWVYNHQHHPVIKTRCNGEPSETPDMIAHDTLGLLQKPTRCGFLFDDPLLPFRSPRANIIQRLLRLNVRRTAVRTAAQRSMLWKTWKSSTSLDGVVTRWLDERLLRRERVLKPYWRRRDRGALRKAEDYLAMNADTATASAELANDISAWTPLAIRLGDMFAFGPGGDSIFYTRTKTLQPDTEETLHVVASDTGTWPNEGGGVSACRRDVINNLRSIRWHMLVESATDFGFPKHQTEENVESLKIVPLWGLDFMAPIHGMFYNKLDSEVDDLAVTKATTDDIKRNFLPTLSALVKGARTSELTAADVQQGTRALVRLNSYFHDSRHWKSVWESPEVKECWRRLWLADLPNSPRPTDWFSAEIPTLSHLDAGLELWFRYLFVFSIPVPDRIPTVFQASHHSVSAAYGVVCKLRRNCVLQIWDHAISWRETNLYLSAALCTLPPFVRNSLLGLMRLTSALTLYHADVMLPCTDTFNPGWEVEIGTAHGMLTSRSRFKRRIDPVVNGITDMHKFAPVAELTTDTPTVTMLSHLWLAKDIKSALLAADVIINQWGFKDYALDIYGALNKAPVYSSECQELIATKGLSPRVTLRGTADPKKVLSATWLFLNSSVSEGLPLALGEAALTGAPVVATDVGASLRVLTDPDTGAIYSEVVAPNDPQSLARAQINILAMLGPWSRYTDDDPSLPAPVLPVNPTAVDVEWVTRRMYEKAQYRRALGMRARDIVLKSFSGERYLREHEQMLWIGKGHWDALDLEPPPVIVDEHGEIIGPADPAAAAAVAAAGGHLDPSLTPLGALGQTQPRAAWLSRDIATSRTSSFTSIYSELGMSTTPPSRPTPGYHASPYRSGSAAASALSVVSGSRVRNLHTPGHSISRARLSGAASVVSSRLNPHTRRNSPAPSIAASEVEDWSAFPVPSEVSTPNMSRMSRATSPGFIPTDPYTASFRNASSTPDSGSGHPGPQVPYTGLPPSGYSSLSQPPHSTPANQLQSQTGSILPSRAPAGYTSLRMERASTGSGAGLGLSAPAYVPSRLSGVRLAEADDWDDDSSPERDPRGQREQWNQGE